MHSWLYKVPLQSDATEPAKAQVGAHLRLVSGETAVGPRIARHTGPHTAGSPTMEQPFAHETGTSLIRTVNAHVHTVL